MGAAGKSAGSEAPHTLGAPPMPNGLPRDQARPLPRFALFHIL